MRAMDYRAAFWSVLTALVMSVILAAIALPEILSHEFNRGYTAGKAMPKIIPQNCLAWWFGGNPVRADRHLRAACAARKHHK